MVAHNKGAQRTLQVKEEAKPEGLPDTTALKEFTPEQKAFREGLESIRDSMKHLTTLSTGSIVFIVAFLEKFSTDPIAVRYIVAAIALLLVSAVISIIIMFEISNNIMNLVKKDNYFKYLYIAPVGCFGIGIFLILYFARLSLWR
jgi:hypothetical protein